MKIPFEGTHKIAPDEPTDCPLCGMTPIRALAIKEPPPMIVRPGWVRCGCRGVQEFHVETELAERDGVEDPRTREARECFYEEANRPHEPESTRKVKARKVYGDQDVRAEQEWQGWSEEEDARSEFQEKLVVTLKGKVPRILRDRLTEVALGAGKSEGWIFRRILERHLLEISEPYKVEYGSDTVMVELMVTRQQADLWKACKVGLTDRTERRVSNADLMAAVMLREWV